MTSGERVICVSETVRAHVRRHWPRVPASRLVVIPRGIDPAEFPRTLTADADWRAQRAAEYPALASGRLLLMPGRGTRLKGHRAALELLAALRGAGEDVRLWLLGTRGEGRETYVAELEAQAARMGVSEWLAITPAREDVQQAYACADLVLQLSSRPEAFGRTVLEALAMGKPVLGWDLGGVGESLRQHFPQGAVAAGDPFALLTRARELLRGTTVVPELANSLAAMQSATLALYDSLVRD
jgi:glycosyltransferase involved in cell wall biosynthesis